MAATWRSDGGHGGRLDAELDVGDLNRPEACAQLGVQADQVDGMLVSPGVVVLNAPANEAPMCRSAAQFMGNDVEELELFRDWGWGSWVIS